jgi:predicted RNase H-like nuclease (RuvC/YqgF family)
MENFKLPIALVAAMAVQLAGGVWWVSQQAATIASLEESVSEFASKMAVEESVNLKRDVQDNAMEIAYLWDETDELWEEADSLSRTIMQITKLQQRVSLLENELKYINRDHNNILDHKGGMK